MTAAEVTLKSPSVSLFQRGNFLHRTLTPLGKACPETSQREGRFLGGVRRELFAELLATTLTGRSKRFRGKARERSTSGGVLNQYVGARRSSATKHMSLFQRPT